MLGRDSRIEVVVSEECAGVQLLPADQNDRDRTELMRNKVNPDFQDRLKDAAKAREDLLAKLRAAPRPDDPVMIEKSRERQAIAKARAERQAERERVRQAEKAAREQAVAEAERIAAEEAARVAAEEAEREAALKAEQKAARDARYAARKLAKKERRKGAKEAKRRF